MQPFHVSQSSPSPPTFPSGFLWGTATSAHQVEGDNSNNDWWAWERQPGRIARGHRAGRAGDWWRAAEADFDRMAALHQNAHRLSIEWSRLERNPGQWDDGALARYREMLTGLRQRGIAPMVTLHHFTFPLWLAARGGWLWPGLPQAFARFARFAAAGLGDLVDLWCTINEPNVAVVLGYLTGRFPPGGGGLRKARDAAVNSLRAHAAAYRTLHGAQPNARVNWAYLDALRDGVLRVGPRVRVPEAAGTLDFIGVNYYSRDLVQFDRRHARTLFGRHFPTPGAPISDGGYGEVYPAGLLRVLLKAHQYGLPIYVTENGLPDEDDNLRPGFLIDHLMELWRASRMGCDVRGYFHWSLIDNFEWADGWTLRFGLIAMDPETQIRTPRSSSTLYSEICRRSALPPAAIAARRVRPEIPPKE